MKNGCICLKFHLQLDHGAKQRFFIPINVKRCLFNTIFVSSGELRSLDPLSVNKNYKERKAFPFPGSRRRLNQAETQSEEKPDIAVVLQQSQQTSTQFKVCLASKSSSNDKKYFCPSFVHRP